MSALPYMKFYPGDEKKKCDHLSAEVFGAYVRLKMKMWDAPTRGQVAYDMRELNRCMGTDGLKEAELIISKLCKDQIFSITDVEGEKYLQDGDMIHQARVSKVRKAVGSEGGKIAQAKIKQKSSKDESKTETFALANSQAKAKQKCEYESDYDNEYVNERIGGAGGKETNYDQSRFAGVSNVALLSLPDCLEVYMYSDICITSRDLLCHNKHFLVRDKDGVINESEVERLKTWIEAFNRVLAKKNVTARGLSEWCDHLYNWINTQNLTEDPKNILSNVTTTGKPNNYTSPIRRGNNATAVIPAGRNFAS